MREPGRIRFKLGGTDTDGLPCQRTTNLVDYIWGYSLSNGVRMEEVQAFGRKIYKGRWSKRIQPFAVSLNWNSCPEMGGDPKNQSNYSM